MSSAGEAFATADKLADGALFNAQSFQVTKLLVKWQKAALAKVGFVFLLCSAYLATL